MDFSSFIKPELGVLIPALYALGATLKHTEKIKDNYIPAILTIVSVLLCGLYELSVDGTSGMAIFTSVVQGFLCAAGAVYANQLYKQVKGGGSSDNS